MKRKNKSFSIDARTIINLGRDSIKNPTAALFEWVEDKISKMNLA